MLLKYWGVIQMMNFNLVFKNVRKSIKDYAIYFITLSLGVSLFYAFNSISSQPSLHQLNYAMKLFGDALIEYIGILSVFVAIILAFLIVYANQFIMKRRKKEIGIYMLLGMNKWHISFIFVGETFVVGLFALIAGLIFGFLLSQVISIIALKMFAGNASGFKLMLSLGAVRKTIICFAVIFFIVMIFNVRSIMNVKIIDLLTANRRNQELRVNNKIISGILFLLSLVFMSVGILLLMKYGLDKKRIYWIIGLAAIGVTLFYYTTSSVMIALLKHNKKMYFHELNTFLFRQLGSKMQTNFLVMIVLCALLLVSLVVLGTGFSVTSSMNRKAQVSTPYDITIIIPYENGVTPLDKAEKAGIPLKENLSEYKQSVLYETRYTYSNLFKGQKIDLTDVEKELVSSHAAFISETDYNNQMSLSHQKQIHLNKNEYAVNANYKRTEKYMRYFLKHKRSIIIGNTKFTPSKTGILNNIINLNTSTNTNDMGTIIVPDDAVRALTYKECMLNGKINSKKKEEIIYKKMNSTWIDLYQEGKIFYITHSVIYDSYFGTFGVIAFISSYLGLILVIVTLSVLSLQQLTETQDNRKHYEILSKIGVDKNMIYSTLFKQIGFYFAAPLILALILSGFVTRAVLNKIEPFFEMKIGQNMMTGFVIILALYAVYFIATYQSAKQIIIEKRIK